MRMLYELIGRVVVNAMKLRYGRQIRVALGIGAAGIAAGIAAGDGPDAALASLTVPGAGAARPWASAGVGRAAGPAFGPGFPAA